MVSVQPKDGAKPLVTHTDAEGKYSLAGVPSGVSAVRVVLPGYEDLSVPSLVFGPGEVKSLALTLVPSQRGTPGFFDEPQFTVSGVKDTTSLGGHGSDSVVRTRDALAKETVILGKPSGFAVGEAPEASVLRARIEREPDNAALHHQLGDALEKLSNPLEALREYQRAAELSPTEPYIFDWGSELLLHHAPEPAIEVFTKGNRIFPQSVRMLIGLGAARFALGSYDEAVQKLCEASDLNPGDPAPYLFLGKIEDAMGTLPDALVERLRRFAAMRPENAEANYYYAVALWKKRGPDDSAALAKIESLLKTAVHLDPKLGAAYLQLGILLSQQRDLPKAISNYQSAIQADPQMEESHYRLAQAYRENGEPDKAKVEIAIYEQMTRQSAEKAECERHEIRQFVYTLRDQPVGQVQ